MIRISGDILVMVDNTDITKKFIVPKEVKHIGKGAFGACYNLEYIELHEDIESIGSEAFLLCKNLKEITLPSKVKILEKAVFASCSALEIVDGLENIEEIHTAAFYKCSKLKKIVLGDKIRTIQNNAFEYCDSIEKMKLPKSLTYIGGNIFYNCEELKEIEVYNASNPENIIFRCIELKKVITDDINVMRSLDNNSDLIEINDIELVIVNNKEIAVKKVSNKYYVLDEKIDIGIKNIEAYKIHDLYENKMFMAVLSNSGQEIKLNIKHKNGEHQDIMGRELRIVSIRLDSLIDKVKMEVKKRFIRGIEYGDTV